MEEEVDLVRVPVAAREVVTAATVVVTAGAATREVVTAGAAEAKDVMAVVVAKVMAEAEVATVADKVMVAVVEIAIARANLISSV